MDHLLSIGAILALLAIILYFYLKCTGKRTVPDKKYDFSQEVPAPLRTLTRTDALINDLVAKLDAPDVPRVSVDEEADLQMSLLGLGRMIEVNVRSAWELYAIGEEIDDPSPRRYMRVLNYWKVHFQPLSLFELFKVAMNITDGVVHGNFYQAFERAKFAYENEEFGLTQDMFHYQTIVTAKLTDKGLNVDAKTGLATTTSGDPAEHRSYIPAKNKTIEENFESFVAAGGFVPVYDVLKTAYSRAYHIKKCIELGKKDA